MMAAPQANLEHQSLQTLRKKSSLVNTDVPDVKEESKWDIKAPFMWTSLGHRTHAVRQLGFSKHGHRSFHPTCSPSTVTGTLCAPPWIGEEGLRG